MLIKKNNPPLLKQTNKQTTRLTDQRVGVEAVLQPRPCAPPYRAQLPLSWTP
jgi:hypothetical protein